MRRHPTLKDALHEALLSHYGQPNEAVVAFPLEEALSSFVIAAGEIALSVPPGPRREAFRFMVDVLNATEQSAIDRVSIGAALAKIKGAHLN